jgi:hypothetical protein
MARASAAHHEAEARRASELGREAECARRLHLRCGSILTEIELCHTYLSLSRNTEGGNAWAGRGRGGKPGSGWQPRSKPCRWR